MGKYKIAVIPGDGIGPEIIKAGIKVLNKIAEKYNHQFEYEEVFMGGCAIDKFGEPLPDKELEKCLKSDSIILGAVGGPKWDNESLNNYEYKKSISKSDFCNLLNIPCDTLEINNEQRSNTNRVNEITINNTTFKGTEVRTKLSLRSTDFKIEIKESEIEITTKGFGHGVGMSQYGANGMAKDGYQYEEILKHYYQNTEIKKI